MARSIDWGPVRKVLDEGRSFLVTSHVNPEGDAIGSEVALAHFLRERSKRVRIVNPSPTPGNCRFLDPEGEIVLFDPSRTEAVFEGIDAIVIVDLSCWGQLGRFAGPVRESVLPRVCIDHHRDGDPEIAPVRVIDPSAAAAGLLLSELFRDAGGPLPLPAAEALYTAILVDTGCFRFSNTDERTLRAAADLVGRGVRPDAVYREAFENKPYRTARLLPAVFSSLGRRCGGKIVWIRVTREMLAGAGASFEDAEGYVEILRAIRGVDVCAVFKEHEERSIRVSLRSTGDVDVQRFALGFGGGGHAKAAGLAVKKTMDEAVREVLAGLEALVGDRPH